MFCLGHYYTSTYPIKLFTKKRFGNLMIRHKWESSLFDELFLKNFSVRS